MKSKKTKELNHQKEGYNDSSCFYDENEIIIKYYSQKVINIFKNNNYKTILSLGVGQGVFIREMLNTYSGINKDEIDSYHIIDGSNELINLINNKYHLPDKFSLVHSLFEDYVPDIKFDLIEMGFVLEHFDDPALILKKFANYLNQSGKIIISVPNARSMHRIIGNLAGFLDDIYLLSEFDLNVGHKRYYDINTIVREIQQAGLTIESIQGLYLKPFTTEQMKSLNLNNKVQDALCKLSEFYTDLANNIFLQAKK